MKSLNIINEGEQRIHTQQTYVSCLLLILCRIGTKAAPAPTWKNTFVLDGETLPAVLTTWLCKMSLAPLPHSLGHSFPRIVT